MHVRRNHERGARNRQRHRAAALVLFDDSQQLTEDARHITPVYFVHDQEELALGGGGSGLAQVLEYPIPRLEDHLVVVCSRSQTFHEVFVAVAWVKSAK